MGRKGRGRLRHRRPASCGRERNPNYDAACFHAQQCAEKYLKAILQEQSIPFGRTHNLIALLDLLLSRNGAWADARQHLEVLTVYAVSVRYPGESVDKSSAREAVRHATIVRSRARRSLSSACLI